MISGWHRVPVLSLALLVSASAATAQGPLTLRQAVDQALGQSPQAAVARADDQEAKSAATIARIQLLPRLSFTEDVSRGNDPVYAFGTRLRLRQFTQADFALNGLNRPQPIGNFATRFSGSWTAFDSLKTQREIHAADLLRASASSSARAVDQQIVLNVVAEYQSALYAQREIEVTQHEQETASTLLASVNGRVQAGLAVESDRMLAEVNLATRKQEAITAQGDLEMAWAQLREAMGVTDLNKSDLRPIERRSFTPLPLEQAMAMAVKTRPDLAGLELAQSAQTATVKATKSAFGPVVSTYGNWEEDRGSLGGAGGNNWVAGVQVGIDILPLGKRAHLAQETAVKQKIDAQLSALRQHVRLQIIQAHLRQETAELTLETAQAAMDQSSESLRIVGNRYREGLANITELLRVEDAERQSHASYWHAVYGGAMAYAELLYATGALTPAAVEELQ